MPETALPPMPATPKAPPSSTPPGGTPTSAMPPQPAVTAPAPTSPPSAEPFRFSAGPDVVEWARGKTAQEVLAIAQGYESAFNRYQGPSVPANAAPTYQPPQQSQPPTGWTPPADDAILTGKDWQNLSQRAFQQYVQPAMQQSVDMAASASYAAVAGKHATGFQKYGPEIQQELAKVPKQYWTLDNLETIVTLVYGRHRDDYAREEAQRLVSQMEPTIRPTGGGSGPIPTQSEQQNPFESESIPADWKMRAKQAGINEATIREFCQANDMSPADFWKQFDSSRPPMVAEAS